MSGVCIRILFKNPIEIFVAGFISFLIRTYSTYWKCIGKYLLSTYCMNEGNKFRKPGKKTTGQKNKVGILEKVSMCRP